MQPQEERQLMEVLSVSLREIPEDGSVSEDDINGNDDFEAHVEEEEEKSELDSEQEQEEEYKIKWTNVRQPVAVVDFTQPSGPTKLLASSQKEKKFFELIFTKKVWSHLSSQTNLYANQMNKITADPEWKAVTVAELKAWVGCLIASRLLGLYMGFSIVLSRFTRKRFSYG